jgi:hypothetical protein
MVEIRSFVTLYNNSERAEMTHTPSAGEHFLVRLDDDGYFFTKFGDPDGDARGVLVPSIAKHFLNYSEADNFCQTLRTRGYDAIVCDRFGAAVTVSTLRRLTVRPIYVALTPATLRYLGVERISLHEIITSTSDFYRAILKHPDGKLNEAAITQALAEKAKVGQ